MPALNLPALRFEAEAFRLGRIDREGANAQLSDPVDVVLHEGAVVHPVQLVAREDQIVIDIPLLEQPLILAHGIGGAFKPAGAVGGLLGGQHLHKALPEAGREVVGHRQVTIERRAVELRQHVDLVDL